MFKNPLVIIAVFAYATLVMGCAGEPVSQSQLVPASANPVPAAATSTSKVTPPVSGSTASPELGASAKLPEAQPAPSPFVIPATPPARISNLPGAPSILVKEYRIDIPASAKLMVFVPALAGGSFAEGPLPICKVAIVLTIATGTTLLLIEHRDDIAKVMTPVFEGTWAEITRWAQSLTSARISSAVSQEMIDQSVGHQDSKGVIMTLQAVASNGILKQNGDGRSDNSVRIFAGFENGRVNFAILYVFGSHMKFAVVSAPLLDGPGTNGFRKIGNTGKYYDPKSLVWSCAWIMAEHVGGSKKLFPPESTWLSAGEGWVAWGVISQRYNLVVPVFEIPLPSLPPGM